MARNKPLYEPFVSKVRTKKYSVYVMKDGKRRLIHFGARHMQQYKDKLGHYTSQDHGDVARRRRYLARAKGIRDKSGKLTWRDKNSANYYSIRYLW